MTTALLIAYSLPMQQDIAAFHDVFGQPNRINTPGPLPLDRIELRLGLIREEGVVELAEAVQRNDTIAIIDALIDTVYVTLGTLIEMGLPADSVLMREGVVATGQPTKNLRLLAARYLAANDERVRDLEVHLRAQNAGVAAYTLTVIAWKALQVLSLAGISAQPFFDEVQRANMSKLGADGRPIHSRGIELDGYPAGKALKGPNYTAPDLAGVYTRLYGRTS